MSCGVTLEWLLPFTLRERFNIEIVDQNSPFKKGRMIDFMPIPSSHEVMKFFPSKIDYTYNFDENYKMPFILKTVK